MRRFKRNCTIRLTTILYNTVTVNTCFCGFGMGAACVGHGLSANTHCRYHVHRFIHGMVITVLLNIIKF